jgi:glycosyltransferase involved in cell wall biosynthesis
VHAAFATVDATIRRPDVIYVHTLPSAPHSILPWLLRETIVVNVNGMDWGRDKWGPVGKAYFKAAAQIALHTAAGIINDSQAMRAYYRQRFGRDSYFVAYGAEIKGSVHPEILSEYGLEPHGYYLIASRLVPENNADLIIEAFRASRSQRTLVIAGGANYKSPWVEALRREADPRVRFLGHIPDAEHVRELHCNCYAYLHGHSLGGTNPALVKALGYGNCIVALDNPFNREVLISPSGTEYGILFPKDAARLTAILDELDADAARAARFRVRAPDRVREAYTWDFIVQEYERIFTDVLASRGQRRQVASERVTPVGHSIDTQAPQTGVIQH